MTIRQLLEEVIADLTAALPAADKADASGAGARGKAGTAVRAAAQKAKADLDGVRKSVLEARTQDVE